MSNDWNSFSSLGTLAGLELTNVVKAVVGGGGAGVGCVCGNGFLSSAQNALTASSPGLKDQRNSIPSNPWEGKAAVAAEQRDWVGGLPGGGGLSA